MAPRHVLRNVLELYAQRGWEPVVAPELEFYLVEPNNDADYPLKPPVGRSGRSEPGRQSYSIAAVNEFDPLFDDIYAVLRRPGHRDRHADPRGWPGADGDQPDPRRRRWISPTRCSCSSAPRARRRCATRCTPPSWPSRTPRSRAAPCTSTRAWSTSRRARTSSAIRTARPRRCSSRTSRGLQKYLPAAMALFCANVNSYRRLTRYLLGADQRALGLRQPHRGPARADVGRRRRGASRIGSAAPMPIPTSRIAASLACGYLGMVEGAAAERADRRQRARPAVRPAALAG